MLLYSTGRSVPVRSRPVGAPQLRSQSGRLPAEDQRRGAGRPLDGGAAAQGERLRSWLPAAAGPADGRR